MAKLIINEENKKSRIEPEIYGHFSEHLGRCIYEGIYVGEKSEIPNVNGMRTDVVDALKELKVPVLRWPGGCFADEYHWMDGIGPKEKRKKMINTHWGGVVEDNSFGTHEYMELCRQIGCKTYVNGNLGSGTVREMSEWVEYMTFEGVSPMADLRKENGHEAPWKVDYFGVGNENWGCGGNMTPEYYANEYRRYQTYVRNYHPDRPIKKICCGANVADYYWTKGVLNTAFDHAEQWHGFMDGLSLHYYVHPEGWEIKGSSTDFDADVWYKTLSKALYMETLIERHGAIMDEYDPDKKVGMIVDEWGTWYTCEPGTNPGFLYQQNTMRDAFVAALSLNVFHKYTDRIKMANIAQIANVLQSMILTKDDKMVLTPSYYVFQMYNVHQDATYLPIEVQCENKQVRARMGQDGEQRTLPMLGATASKAQDGAVHISLSNVDLENSNEVTVDLSGLGMKSVAGRILTCKAITDKNTFEQPDAVKPADFKGAKLKNGKLTVKMPPMSIVALELR